MTHENANLAWPPELTENRIHCVYLTCFRPEFSSLAIVLQYSGIQVQQAVSLEEADFLMTVTGATVFLTDVTFPDGDWRDALQMTAQMHSHAVSLIAAAPKDRPYLADAAAAGACGVLWKPFDFAEAIRLIRTVDEASRNRPGWPSAAARAGRRK